MDAQDKENLLQTALADSRYQHIQQSLSTPTDHTPAPMLLERCVARHAAVHSSSCSLLPTSPPCAVRNSPAILERVTAGLPRPVIWKHLWLKTRKTERYIKGKIKYKRTEMILCLLLKHLPFTSERRLPLEIKCKTHLFLSEIWQQTRKSILSGAHKLLTQIKTH